MSMKFTHMAGLVVAATLIATGSASAQEKHARHVKVASHRAVLLAEMKAPPLTIQKRSFLDPGNVVSPSTDTPEYLAANTSELVPIYQSYAPGRFGESTLAGRFDLPNNPRFEPNRDLDFSPF